MHALDTTQNDGLRARDRFRRAARRAGRVVLVGSALVVSCALAACTLVGCATSVEPSYDDPAPEARLGAIRASAAAGNRADVPRLVECLSSDDPAVRLAAIEGLKRITDTTLGYRASAPPQDRERAIAKWTDWVREQGIEPHPETLPNR